MNRSVSPHRIAHRSESPLPRRTIALALALAALVTPLAQAQHAIVYRGTLQDGGKPANGLFELELRLYDAVDGGTALSETMTLSQVKVRDGRFEVELDLPEGLQRHPDAFLQAAVKGAGESQFHPLQGRQQVKGGVNQCWTVGGNDLSSGGLGLNSTATPTLLRVFSGNTSLYVRNNGGIEQGTSTASGAGSTALNVSTARGPFSVAAGKGEVQTTHGYSFAFADGQSGTFTTSAPDQFIVRARNGVGVNVAPPDLNVELTVGATEGAGNLPDIWMRPNPALTINPAGIMLTAGGASPSVPFANNAGFYIDHRSADGNTFFRRLALQPSGEVIVRSSTSNLAAGVSMAAGSGAWSSLSDRRLKTAVMPIDAGSVLERVVSLPMNSWSYLAQGDGVRHLGPMAQDFAAAFGLGENDTTISSIDADGVALAAIQGLNAKLESENAALRARLASIEAALDALTSHAPR